MAPSATPSDTSHFAVKLSNIPLDVPALYSGEPQGTDIVNPYTLGAEFSFTTPGIITISKVEIPPAGTYFAIDAIPVYYNIETSAQFEDEVIIEIPYDPAKVSGDESELRLYQFKDGVPVDITWGRPDTARHIIMGVVKDHFCTFAIGKPYSASIEYIGQPIVKYTGSISLTARITSENGPDLTLGKVQFEISAKNSDGTSRYIGSFTALCDSSGIASITAPLGAGIYTITTSIVENGFFKPDEVTKFCEVQYNFSGVLQPINKATLRLMTPIL